MKVICRAGVGVDNVDVRAASRKGIIVMNTPGGNTTSTAEHTMALLLAMVRNIPQAAASVKAGAWERKKFTGAQLAGKVLGILGLGRVGAEVARRARAFEMKVLAHDPYVVEGSRQAEGVELVKSLEELLRKSDVVTVHTPLTDETRGMIGREEIALMKDGARIINAARGGVVDEEALCEAIQSGKLAGAALDVFVEEPPEGNPLISLDSVVATPHLGASTEEAQIAVSVDAARQMVDALSGREVRFTVNFPAVDPEELKDLGPYLDLVERMGLLQMQLLNRRVKRVELVYYGDVARKRLRPITTFYTIGLLKPILGEHLNMVSAPVLAEERGIEITQTLSSGRENFSSAITARLWAEDGTEHSMTGTVFDRKIPRIVRIEGFEVEVIPDGEMLVVFDRDRPGLIADMAGVLGRAGINIGRMTFGRKDTGGDAITVFNLDAAPDERVLEGMRKVPGVESVHLVHMGGESRVERPTSPK